MKVVFNDSLVCFCNSMRVRFISVSNRVHHVSGGRVRYPQSSFHRTTCLNDLDKASEVQFRVESEIVHVSDQDCNSFLQESIRNVRGPSASNEPQDRSTAPQGRPDSPCPIHPLRHRHRHHPNLHRLHAPGFSRGRGGGSLVRSRHRNRPRGVSLHFLLLLFAEQAPTPVVSHVSRPTCLG
jgi:hypothetical protein